MEDTILLTIRDHGIPKKQWIKSYTLLGTVVQVSQKQNFARQLRFRMFRALDSNSTRLCSKLSRDCRAHEAGVGHGVGALRGLGFKDLGFRV